MQTGAQDNRLDLGERADPPTSEQPLWQMPRLSDNALIGGVAAGLAEEIGVDPIVIRAAFVVLTIAGGWGALLYVAAWAIMSLAASDIGPADRCPKGATETNRLLGVGLVFFGLLGLAQAIGFVFVESLVWPIALFAAGGVVAQHRGVDIGLGRVAESDDQDRSAFLVRVAGGSLLVLAGVSLAISLNFDLATARDTVLVVGIVVAGLALVLGPWVVGLVNDLTAERRARIRSEERAEMAAHLHDSVLQTLSLIQRRADDPEVVSLARKQERELRGWLHGASAPGDRSSFRALLEAEIAEVEELHAVPIEVVIVGDAMADDELRAVVAATREAATNAVVHAHVSVVDVFAEVTPEAVDVFVRDVGVGFDPETVPDDRRGVAESIIGRMERLGGRATVTSSPGEGTEVELHIERRHA